MSDDEKTDVPEPDETIERYDTGVAIEVNMTRGTGTRDQEKIKGKVKRKTLEEAREDIDELKEDLAALAGYVRGIE